MMKRGNYFRNQGLPNLVKVEIGVGKFTESDE